MKYKKGNQIGLMIWLAVGAIVCISLLMATYEPINTVSSTRGQIGQAITLPAQNSTLTLKGQAISSLTIVNATNFLIDAGNYTILNYVVSNGGLIAQINLTGAQFAGKAATANYTYEPFGYDTSSGGRAMALLIPILATIALVVALLIPSIRETLGDIMNV